MGMTVPTHFVFAAYILTPPSSKQSLSNNSIERRYVVKQMPDIERIVSLYELYKSYVNGGSNFPTRGGINSPV